MEAPFQGRLHLYYWNVFLSDFLDNVESILAELGDGSLILGSYSFLSVKFPHENN